MNALRFLVRDGKERRIDHTAEVELPQLQPRLVTMKIKVAMLGALVAAAGTWSSAFAQQTPPPGSVMLVPGVYTTPEISAKCQAFAAKRVVGGSNTDTSRQAVALACAKKLMAREAKKKKA